ncbi:hypothetical protein LTR50_005688 [Elasticomyces elasticus]|nr:hypothetical protein LTR50_005688 [Elasticomyces elasticus]
MLDQPIAPTSARPSPIATSPDATTQKIILTSSDGVGVPTEREAIERSLLIKDMADDLGDPDQEPIPIKTVTEPIFRKVLDWCEHHRKDHPAFNDDDDADNRKKTTGMEE